MHYNGITFKWVLVKFFNYILLKFIDANEGKLFMVNLRICGDLGCLDIKPIQAEQKLFKWYTILGHLC